MQHNPLTDNHILPQQPQFSSQQQNGYSTQEPQSLNNGQYYYQQMDHSNGNIEPFDYNVGHMSTLYSSNEMVPPLHPQQSHQPSTQCPQMNTSIQTTSSLLQQQQQQQYHHNSKEDISSSTRLSEKNNEHYTTEQLKMVTSKERRQLRNKVSARNFRNRRKEYITSLEEQVNTYKNENGQLQLEIKWVRTTMNKLQKENDDLRVKLALCRGGITMKQDSTLSDRHSSQGLSPPTTTITTPPVPPSSPSSPSPALLLLSDHPSSVQPTLATTTDTNTSQNQNSALTQNGNSSFTIPDLHGSSHQYHQQQQQHPPPVSLDSINQKQQSASIHPRENNEKTNPSVMVITSSSLPGTNLDSIDTNSSLFHAGHLSLSTDFTMSNNEWDIALPNDQVSLTYPLDSTTITQPLMVPPLFENPSSSSFYSLESQQNSVSRNQQHLTSAQIHPSFHHMQEHSQLPLLPPLLPRSQPPDQQLEYSSIDSNNNNNNNNNSFVSTAIIPGFDYGTALGKQQQKQANDGSILWKYPLLVPALVSMIIDHTMTMSSDELLSHARLSSAEIPPQQLQPIDHTNGGGGLKSPYLTNNMAPGLRYPNQQQNQQSSLTDAYPLSKKQLDALWNHLLDQMTMTATSQQQPSSTEMVDEENDINDWNHDGSDDNNDQHQTFWDDTPVTGFKAICPLYWMQRQLCRFVITYVIVKYPQLEIPCKVYLPICEQFRRRLIHTSS